MQIGIAMTSINVKLHDHVIVGAGYYSMADEGIIDTIRSRLSGLVAV